MMFLKMKKKREIDLITRREFYLFNQTRTIYEYGIHNDYTYLFTSTHSMIVLKSGGGCGNC